ncbi:hypothetical protein FACS189472_13670 [Alphaproteobacteria bacterium]|nr:hypothetical protein FACS189472_13670 [Alphaproteobacteria bacterium]
MYSKTHEQNIQTRQQKMGMGKGMKRNPCNTQKIKNKLRAVLKEKEITIIKISF